MFKRRYLSPIVVAVVACAAALSNLPPNRVGANAPPVVVATPAADVAAARNALEQGASLLRNNHADLALPLLESALKLYTQANDQNGMASAHDAIGDIYLQGGQYNTAAEHFQHAADSFCPGKEAAKAALMFAKLGETYYLSGNEEAARAAFAKIGDKRCGGGGAGLGAGGGGGGVNNGGNSNRRDSATFAFISASLPGISSCGAFKPGGSPIVPASSAAGVAAGVVERTLGHGPRGAQKTVRMDLRVTDQNGEPVPDVRAKLWSEQQPNGFLCECEHTTDPNGRVLMDPIHYTKTLNLNLQAKGYEPRVITVDPKQLDQPYHVVLQSNDAAAAAARAASVVPPLAAAPRKQNDANDLSNTCYDFYRLFYAYASGELALGRADFKNNQLNSAEVHFRNILAAADRDGQAGNLAAARLFRAVARTSLGDIAARQGRYSDAVSLYTQAAEIARQDDRPELVWGAQRGLGKANWALTASARNPAEAAKYRDEAIRNYRAALDTIETLFEGSLRADDARTSFLATTKDVFDEAAGALAESALTNAPQSSASPNQALAHAASSAEPAPDSRSLAYMTEAFQISERGRARSLLDMLGDSKAQITEGVAPALLQRKAANMARQQELASVLTGVTGKPDGQKQTVGELEAELARLNVEFNSLENQIRTSSPRYGALVRPQPLTLAQVQQQVLDDSTVLLEYNLGAERSYMWTVTRTGLQVYRLPPRAAVERQAIELRQQLLPAGSRRAIAGIDVESTRGLSGELTTAQGATGRGLVLGGPSTAPPNVAAYAAASNALYKTVVAPAAATIKDKRVLVVADGALNYVPFEALVSSTQGVDFSVLPYLVKTNEIVYAPSASVVAVVRQQSRAGAARAGGMLVVADPVFDASDARLKGSTPGAANARASVQRMALSSAISDVTSLKTPGLKLVRLGGTRTEAEQIAQLARSAGNQADVWLDFDASEANVERRELGRYRVLHFATHGLLDAERPQFTGLALSLVGETNADGFLRAAEVFNLKLGSPLVMLSACETGLGKERRGEGVIGLTRAFMYAGAPTVGVSLWSVADKSTAELMPDFYKRMFTGQASAPAALRAAQVSMITNKRYSAPFYWAPFVLVGDWR